MCIKRSSSISSMVGAALAAAVLFAGSASAQDAPGADSGNRRQLAVHVTGAGDESVKKARGNEIFYSLVKSGKNTGADRPNDFYAAIAQEQQKAPINDVRLVEIGKQFGVDFICTADITSVFETTQIAIRMVNVRAGGRVDAVGNVYNGLKTLKELSTAAAEAVKSMTDGKTGGR